MPCYVNRRRTRLGTLVVVATLAALATSPAMGADADETWTIGGQVFEDVRVQIVSDATVTIFHRGGISQLELEKLPPDLQARFGYDPEKAGAWKQQADAQLSQTRQAAEAVLAHRIRRAETAEAAAAAERAGKTVIQVELHEEIDLRPLYSNYGLHFKDQGRRPSCAVFAAVSAVEYELARTEGLPSPLSEEFLIWAVRELQPGIPIDDGYHFAEVVSAMQTYGIPRQAFLPNTFGRPISQIQPSQDAIVDASTRRNIVPVWYRANDSNLVARLVHALNQRTPVVVGLRWPNWRTLQGNHLLRTQQPVGGGGHAVTLVGYRCPERRVENLVFIFRNSYGVDWGLGGCGFVAESYLRQHLLAAFHVTIPSAVAAAR